MSLVFASICPHPPIIIPEVGGSDTKKVTKTISAMKRLATIAADADPDLLIVISPHGLLYPDRMNVCGQSKLAGNFGNFGAPQVKMSLEGDVDLAIKIDQVANEADIETLLYDNGSDTYDLDHGCMVPLYYLLREINRVKVLPIGYSYQSRASHFAFGQVIRDLAQKSNQRIGIIASGDLSHRLLPSSPDGHSASGQKFDQTLTKLLERDKISRILNIDDDLVEQAGECGYHSILVLLGALDQIKSHPQILSYEGPFGVGYLVANYQIY